MVFSSLVFLFLFLPLVLSAYYAVSLKYRNFVLLLFSYLFYIWGGGVFTLLLIAATVSDYIFGIQIEKNGRWKRAITALCISLDLGLLAYFKYANFFISQVNGTLAHFGLSGIGWTNVVLPIGISFFTFHKISYIIDVYRGTCKAFRNFFDFALYISFFPQLVAGPIVRFHEINKQIENRTESIAEIKDGFVRFSWGLVKKVVFANSCGEIADAVFALDQGHLDTKTAWLGIAAYTLQIYFDFSGYSDMAIGLGHLFGFRLPENFDRPYSAVSITDFWRRWHMSLSRFFRDYLYIPLGGNRKGATATYFNLWIVFVLCGLWHGANWTFIVWGAFHGSLLMLERLTGLRHEREGFMILKRISTLLLVMAGWVFFRSESIHQALAYMKTMFFPVNYSLPFEVALVLNPRNVLIMALASLVVFLPRDLKISDIFIEKRQGLTGPALACLLIFLSIYSIALITSGSYNPFIYFRF